jgi:translation initiation factor 6 (eIF-6)
MSGYVLGLDLAQTTDFTALAIGELVTGNPAQVLIRHLERLPKQTPYPQQVAIVGEKVARVRDLGRTILAIDQTGVGRPVVDSFRLAKLQVPIWPITIAGSQMGQAKRNPETHDWVIPKKDLVGALMTLAHSGRFLISDALPSDIQRIAKEELRSFRMKITAAANLTFEAWREGDHDDIVLALAMVAWVAQRWATPGGLV